MARIKIKDLPMNQQIGREEIKKVTGGLLTRSSLFGRSYNTQTSVFSVDTVTGYVTFGDGIQGAIPPTGTSNVTATYGNDD